MLIQPLPAFNDNYLWLAHDGKNAVVVDPGDAQPVLAALQAQQLTLQAIVLTHHHGDHTGGVAALRQATQCRVLGPAQEKLPEPVERVHAGQRIALLGTDWLVLAVPGHTAGHIAWYAPDLVAGGALFCGDTLFSAGCGRLFEGTAAQMLQSLAKLAALPANTRVCCAHEYTLANLQFAAAVEPHNTALRDYTAHCQQLRQQHLPTLPSTLAQELAINPFLRLNQPAVQAAAQQHAPSANTPEQLLAALRDWKNTF